MTMFRPSIATALLTSTFLSASFAVLPAAWAQSAGAEPTAVDVTRVTLATGGLAQVEGQMAEAGERMSIAIERPQIADVLRTLVVTGEASVRSIDLDAAEPVGERSVAGKLLAGDLADPRTLLQSLIGEEVELSGGPNRLSGRLLAFDEVVIPGGEDEGQKPGVRVSVATTDGRVAFATFPSLDAISVSGAAVEERMDSVVPAIGESVDDGRRELSVRLGSPAQAGFSFVVPTTVWRPSYRALIGADAEVSLQGWATLENTTGLDWKDIELNLAVGTPVAYAQDIYSPLRTQRPNAPFEVGRTVETDLVEPSIRQRGGLLQLDAAAGIAMDAPMAEQSAMRSIRRSPVPAAALETGGPAVSGSATTIFPVAGSIDLQAGRTLSVPFLDASRGAERITYLDLNNEARGVLDALEVAFDEEATVPGGLIAVYDERGFVGDARFAGADGGETSILPFAVTADLDTRVQRRDQVTLAGASLVDGTLILRRERVTRLEMTLDASEPTSFVLDTSREPNAAMELTGAEGVIEELQPSRVRARIDLDAGTTEMSLVGTRLVAERISVTNLPTSLIEEVLSLGDEIDADTRAQLEAIAAATARLADIDRRIEARDADVRDLREVLESDRENIRAIDVTTPEGAAVRDRIVRRSNELDAILQELQELRRQRLAEQSRLRAG